MVTLPQEIVEKIMKYYWQINYYKVINEINLISNTTSKLQNAHYAFMTANNGSVKFKIMKRYNDYLKYLSENKGTRLLSKVIDYKLCYLFGYGNNIFTDEDIGLIYYYLSIESGISRFIVFGDYLDTAKYNYSNIKDL